MNKVYNISVFFTNENGYFHKVFDGTWMDMPQELKNYQFEKVYYDKYTNCIIIEIHDYE